MLKTPRKALAALLCLALLLGLAPTALAAEYRTEAIDADVITGFEGSDLPLTVDTDYKLALIELQKCFPAALTVLRGGTVFYDRDGAVLRVEPAARESIAVTWKCLEDYDDDMDVFHFVPALDLRLAEGVELPIVTVNILGELEIPPLVTLPEEPPISSASLGSGAAQAANLPAATVNISPDAFSGTQDLTILGQAGSYAETYANEHGFGFMPVVE